MPQMVHTCAEIVQNNIMARPVTHGTSDTQYIVYVRTFQNNPHNVSVGAHSFLPVIMAGKKERMGTLYLAC